MKNHKCWNLFCKASYFQFLKSVSISQQLNWFWKPAWQSHVPTIADTVFLSVTYFWSIKHIFYEMQGIKLNAIQVYAQTSMNRDVYAWKSVS